TSSTTSRSASSRNRARGGWRCWARQPWAWGGAAGALEAGPALREHTAPEARRASGAFIWTPMAEPRAEHRVEPTAPQRIVFNSSFPRSGSTLLQNVLAQNPRFYCSPTSGVVNLLLAARQKFSPAGRIGGTPTASARGPGPGT